MSHRNGPVGLSLVAGAAGIYFYTLRQVRSQPVVSAETAARALLSPLLLAVEFWVMCIVWHRRGWVTPASAGFHVAGACGDTKSVFGGTADTPLVTVALMASFPPCDPVYPYLVLCRWMGRFCRCV